MGSFIVLLVVSILVSAFHMLAPDHWVPLTVISSTRKYSRTRTYTMGAALGFTHAATSIIVAVSIYYAGLVLIHNYVNDLIIFGQVFLVIIGIYFIINGYRETPFSESGITDTSVISLSAFPDLSLMPIIISAASLQTIQISAILIVFAVSSTISLTAMAMLADKSLGRILSKVPPKYVDYLIGAVLIATALFLSIV